MAPRIGKVTLGEEIELLRDLERTIKIAIARATLFAASTGDEETATDMTATADGTLAVALDRTRLAIFRAQEAADGHIDDMVTRERGEQELVSLQEDLGR